MVDLLDVLIPQRTIRITTPRRNFHLHGLQDRNLKNVRTLFYVFECVYSTAMIMNLFPSAHHDHTYRACFKYINSRVSAHEMCFMVVTLWADQQWL